jgi:hypothetical protein
MKCGINQVCDNNPVWMYAPWTKVIYFTFFFFLDKYSLNLNLKCSSACDGGIMYRSVMCFTKKNKLEEVCNLKTKPQNYKICNTQDCITNSKIIMKKYKINSLNGMSSIKLIIFFFFF